MHTKDKRAIARAAIQILTRLIDLERARWSVPGQYQPAEVQHLERQYQDLTGRQVPTWPRRARS